MSAIVKIQKEYFLTEDVYTLKPMMIKNVADITGLDISVISRATSPSLGVHSPCVSSSALPKVRRRRGVRSLPIVS